MEDLGDNNLININIQHDILYEQYMVQESTCKTDIEAAVEAAQGLFPWTSVPLPRPATLVVLWLTQGAGVTLAGGRGDTHLGTHSGIL